MSGNSVPRVIVFDLDGTLWRPEMYELWGGGAPFTLSKGNPSAATDRSNTEVRLIGETRELLQTLSTAEEWRGTQLAISSTCDEPRWALELLRLFQFTDAKGESVPMLSLFGDLVEIYKANKKTQHQTILRKAQRCDPSIKSDFSDFLFFDNQQDNISHVSSIGVTSIYCPNGMVRGVFERGLKEWREIRKRGVK
uniref:Uncharacterized protein TCIL3000_11_2570 n=1 Tax=Trypanosoma congolense (strain IL3000) TaxID=1068625 RepID=G0UZP6_TRYCI|nr:unnamed protein product [Trypanosoma congolense IL3000]